MHRGNGSAVPGVLSDSDWPNSSRVTSVKNSGRPSRAKASTPVSPTRTGSGRGRPPRWASAASMAGAAPLRPVSSAANATVWPSGSGRGWGISTTPHLLSARLVGGVPGSQHGLARDGLDVAGLGAQRSRLADPGDGLKLAQRGARSQVIADEAGPAAGHRQPRRGQVSRQRGREVGDSGQRVSALAAPHVPERGDLDLLAWRKGWSVHELSSRSISAEKGSMSLLSGNLIVAASELGLLAPRPE